MNKDNIIGGWKLVECTMKDCKGNIHYPYGKTPIGILTYTIDGFMSANIIASRGRNSLIAEGISLNAITEGKAAYVSYSGTYTLFEKSVVHHVKVALIPEWIGGDQKRNMEFKNNCLILSTDLILEDGSIQSFSLEWKR